MYNILIGHCINYFHRKFLQVISPFISEQILFTVQILQPARVSYKCLLDVDKDSMTRILCALSKSGDSREPELRAVREVR